MTVYTGRKYKLVTQDYISYKGTAWRRAGKWLTVRAQGPASDLCSSGVVHYYEHPVLAVIFNTVHAGISNPRLLQIKTSRCVAHDGLKGGCKVAKAVKELPLPTIAAPTYIEFVAKVYTKLKGSPYLSSNIWPSYASTSFRQRNESPTAPIVLQRAQNSLFSLSDVPGVVDVFKEVLASMGLD